mmetsp:Transcript_49015/g.129838  ORF Transcript_49015/g.129838 Transcript_49015/m.129838 type:complete len:333 (-) Transcript_49015:1535-2533(-)
MTVALSASSIDFCMAQRALPPYLHARVVGFFLFRSWVAALARGLQPHLGICRGGIEELHLLSPCEQLVLLHRSNLCSLQSHLLEVRGFAFNALFWNVPVQHRVSPSATRAHPTRLFHLYLDHIMARFLAMGLATLRIRRDLARSTPPRLHVHLHHGFRLLDHRVLRLQLVQSRMPLRLLFVLDQRLETRILFPHEVLLGVQCRQLHGHPRAKLRLQHFRSTFLSSLALLAAAPHLKQGRKSFLLPCTRLRCLGDRGESAFALVWLRFQVQVREQTAKTRFLRSLDHFLGGRHAGCQRVVWVRSGKPLWKHCFHPEQRQFGPLAGVSPLAFWG